MSPSFTPTRRRPLLIASLATLLYLPSAVFAQDRVVQFEKRNVTIPVMSEAQFKDLAASNRQILRDPEKLIQLARELGGSDGLDGLENANKMFIELTWDGDATENTRTNCGEAVYGDFFAALQNPELDEAVAAQIVAEFDAEIPLFSKVKEFGHFRFFYMTDNNIDPNHNVTDDAIEATATVMNGAWDDFAINFMVPKHRVEADGKEMIDVKVYDLPLAGLYGVTNSNWDHIELDSVRVVRNPCNRQTTPVHELFHRVQYSYGYVTGTPELRWAVEATASWSQKHRATDVGDWLDRMNAGFESAETRLVDRSYDAIPLWVYLGQRIDNEAKGINDVWSAFRENGHDMKMALGKVVSRGLAPLNLEQFLLEWHWANLRKDYSPQQEKFDYDEDEEIVACGNVTHGPLAEVTPQLHTLNVNDNFSSPAAVAEFAANYHRYQVHQGVQRVKLTISPSDNGKMGIGVLATRGNLAVMEVFPSIIAAEWTYTVNINAVGATDLFVVLVGTDGGVDYRIAVAAE